MIPERTGLDFSTLDRCPLEWLHSVYIPCPTCGCVRLITIAEFEAREVRRKIHLRKLRDSLMENKN